MEIIITKEGKESQVKVTELIENLVEQARQVGEKDFQPGPITEKLEKYLGIFQMGPQKTISEAQLIQLLANICTEENYPVLAHSLSSSKPPAFLPVNNPQLFPRNIQEKLKKLYLPVALQKLEIDDLVKKLADCHCTNPLSEKIQSLIRQNRFLPHQNVLKEKRPFSHMQINLQDNFADIFDQLKQAAINFQNLTATTINFSSLRPKMSIVKSTQGFSSGPVSFIKIYTSTFEALRQNLSTDFTPLQTFLLNISHPDILEYLIFIKNFQKNSLNKHLEFLIELTPNFLEALHREEDFELINPENGQVINLLSAKNTFDLIVSTILENPALGLTTSNNSSSGENNSISISGLINLSAYSQLKKAQSQLLEDLGYIENYLSNQLVPCSKQINLPGQLKLQFTGWNDFLIGQNIAFGSVASLEMAEQLFKSVREKVSPAIKLEIDLRSPLLTALDNTRGLECLDQLVSAKTNLDGQEIYQIYPALKEKLTLLGLANPELIKQIYENNSLNEQYQIPVQIKNLFKTSSEISPSFHLEFQRSLEKFIDGTVEKKIYFANSLDLEKIKSSLLEEIQAGIHSIRLCQFENGPKSDPISNEQGADRNFLLSLGKNKKRRHREIQPPLFQIKKTEEITLPPIST